MSSEKIFKNFVLIFSGAVLAFGMGFTSYITSSRGAGRIIVSGRDWNELFNDYILWIVGGLFILFIIREWFLRSEKPKLSSLGDITRREKVIERVLELTLRHYYEHLSKSIRQEKDKVTKDLLDLLDLYYTNDGLVSDQESSPIDINLSHSLKRFHEVFRTKDNVIPVVRANIMLIKHCGMFKLQRRLKMQFSSIYPHPLLNEISDYGETDRRMEWEQGSGKCGAAWRDGQRAIYAEGVEDFNTFGEALPADAEYLEQYNSVLSIPIWNLKHTKIIGVLSLDSIEEGDITRFSDAELIKQVVSWNEVYSCLLQEFENGIDVPVIPPSNNSQD